MAVVYVGAGPSSNVRAISLRLVFPCPIAFSVGGGVVGVGCGVLVGVGDGVLVAVGASVAVGARAVEGVVVSEALPVIRRHSNASSSTAIGSFLRAFPGWPSWGAAVAGREWRISFLLSGPALVSPTRAASIGGGWMLPACSIACLCHGMSAQTLRRCMGYYRSAYSAVPICCLER